MATLDQIYRAYLNEDPNVSQMNWDPFSWNIEQTFDDTVDDTTTTLPATGGITSAYTGGGGGGMFGYDQGVSRLDPVNLGYAGLDDSTREFLIRAQEQAAKSPGYPGTQDDEEGGFLNWLRQQTGKITPGMKKTGIATAALGLLPFPLNLVGAAAPFLPKGEGYKSAGLNAMDKGLYDTLASQGMLYETPGGIKTITGKNVFSGFDKDDWSKNYIEGQQEIYDKYMDKYGSEEEVEKYFKKNPKTTNFLQKQWKESKTALGYIDQFTELKYAGAKVPESIADTKDEPVITPTVHHGDIAHGEGGRFDTPSAPAPVHQFHPAQGGQHQGAGGGVSTAGQAIGTSRSSPQDAQGSWYPGAKEGGLIRKKYGNGGIVDLL